MRGIRAAITSLSTSWSAADLAGLSRALRITASILATTAVVGLASVVAVALSLT